MTILTCAKCGAKNRVDERVTVVGKQPVCGKCGASLEGVGGVETAHAGGTAGAAGANTARGAAGASGAANSTGGTGASGAGSKPVTVTDATFAREVVEASKAVPVLLDCWAAWCGPCRMIAPALEELAAESGGRYRVAKLNVDENPQTSAALRIQSIPTLFVYKNGQSVERIVGAQPKQVLAARLAANL
jgi:thioredoxin